MASYNLWAHKESDTTEHIPTYSITFSSVQLLSCVQLFVTLWIAARQASLSITNSQSSPKLMCIESVMPSSHLILCCPLRLLPPIPPSIRVFSNESALHMRWPKYWSFSFSISPSNEHPGLISFRMAWLISLQSKGLFLLINLLSYLDKPAGCLQCHLWSGRPGVWSRVWEDSPGEGKGYPLRYSGLESMGSQRVLTGLRDFHIILRNVAT